MRVGSHPGYGRMVFDWPARPDYRVETEGSQVVLRFPQGATLDLGTASSRLPRNVVSVAAEDGGVRVAVRPGARIRHFNHGSKVVLDVLDPPPASDAAAADPAGNIAALAATPVVEAAAGRVQIPDAASPVVVASTDLRDVLAAAPFARSGGVPASDNPSPSAALAQAALPPAGNPFPPSQMPSVGGAQPAQAQPTRAAPQTVPLTIEQGSGRLVQLSAPALTILAADPRIARVQPASPTSLFIMGVNAGRTNIIATAEDGSPVAEFEVTVQATRTTNSDVSSAVVPSAPPAPPLNAGEVQSTIRRLVRGAESVRVSNVGRNGLALSGMVPSAADAQRAEAIARAYAGQGREVINNISLLSSIQVNLRVRVAEISREVVRNLGFNWLALANDGANWAIGLRTGAGVLGSAIGSIVTSSANTGGAYAGRYVSSRFDINAVVDALAQDRLITILAEPNLTAQSGEVASFLAGGEFPVPVASGGNDNTVTVEFKQFGVSLAFVPTVLAQDRLNLRVRPEVSELSETNSITMPLAGGVVRIPGLTVRRAETTVELGSGQSFAIAGLLQRGSFTNNDGVTGLGDIPVLGALFRSDRFRRNETELVILVTPYLVRPVSDPQALAVPTDTFRPATDLDRILLRRQISRGAPATTQVQAPAGAGFIVE